MAATTTSTRPKSLYKSGIFINIASRCSRIRFEDLNLDEGTCVSIIWFNCYDAHLGVDASWREIKSSSSSTLVQSDGSAEFLLYFGPGLKEKKDGICHLILDRPAGGAEATVLPTLSYVLRSIDLGFHHEGVIPLYKSWEDVVYKDAITNFEEFAHSPTNTTIDTYRAMHAMETVWQQVFGYLIRKQRLGKGEACSSNDVPPFTKETAARIILVAVGASELPSMISRRCFCGFVDNKEPGVWRIFRSLVDIVGRSLFLRRLHTAGQLYVLGNTETIEIHVDKLAENDQTIVHFFRLPRSVLGEPALVIELFTIERRGRNDAVLTPMLPKPYITASQLEKAQGLPYTAFSHLDSRHHDLLAKLTAKELVQPPICQVRRVFTDVEHIVEPIDIEAPLEKLDDDWWVTSEIKNWK